MEKLPEASTVYDPASRTHFTVAGNQWVGYDRPDTMHDKVDHALSMGLAGVMVWALDLDDFIHGSPLISAIGQRLFVVESQEVVLTVAADDDGSGGRRLQAGRTLSVEEVRLLHTRCLLKLLAVCVCGRRCWSSRLLLLGAWCWHGLMACGTSPTHSEPASPRL